MMQKPSPEYLKLMEEGAFPNHLDPWAEDSRYFHQLHGHMIGYLLDQIRKPAYELGYHVGRETSVQISGAYYPDIAIESQTKPSPTHQKYAHFAEILDVEAGTIVESQTLDLDRLFIEEIETGDVVTVIEFVSPSNKNLAQKIEAYQWRRAKLLSEGVHVVEIDFTRSVKRLLDSPLTAAFPYHIAIYPYDEEPRFIGMRLWDAPKAFAIPLRNEAIRADLAPVYREAYRQLMLASQILKHQQYHEDALPFPSLLTAEEKSKLFDAVKQWQTALKSLQDA